MDSEKEIAEMSEKMKGMSDILNKNLFQNPIKDIQREMLKEVLELKETVLKNINDLSKEQTNATTSQGMINCNSEAYNDMKVALDHKTYQVERLKDAFNEYERISEDEISKLKTENDKLKYRINILMKSLDEKENSKAA